MAPKTSTLAELGLTAQGAREAQVTGLAVDNRLVRRGDLFAAMPGTQTHGAAYADAAIAAGAVAVLTDADGAAMISGDAAIIIAQQFKELAHIMVAVDVSKQVQ